MNEYCNVCETSTINTKNIAMILKQYCYKIIIVQLFNLFCNILEEKLKNKRILLIVMSIFIIFSNVTPALALDASPEMVSPGVLHTRYVKNGELYAWGDNTFGELGDGTCITRLMPVKIPFDKGTIASIAAGYGFSLILTTDGKLWALGLTYDESNPYNLEPVMVLDFVKAISARTDFAFALKNDSTVWARGKNSQGQLGINSTIDQSSFVQVGNLAGITQVSAGYDHGLALDQNGKVWAWGSNTYGQLGTGDDAEKRSPVQNAQLTDIKQISAGYEYSLALDITGKAYAWGKNDVGQLGVGKNTYETEYSPVQVKPSTALPLAVLRQAPTTRLHMPTTN